MPFFFVHFNGFVLKTGKYIYQLGFNILAIVYERGKYARNRLKGKLVKCQKGKHHPAHCMKLVTLRELRKKSFPAIMPADNYYMSAKGIFH